MAAAQIAHHYWIPLYSTAGITNSKIPDAQASYEKALQQVLVGLAGGNLIHNAAGMLDKMITRNLEQMLIDDEVIGMVKRIMRGIDVSSNTLATEVIEKVGPGGNYLGERHTRVHYLKEHDLMRLSDRSARDAWEKAGRRDVLLRAKDMVREKLRDHKVEPLDVGIARSLEAIVRDSERSAVRSRTP